MNRSRHHTSGNSFCDCMIHPFQMDSGVSQHQRLMDELDVKRVKIDARSTADLLHYFYQLASQINYYDAELKVSDWKPFFERSVPFVLAEIIHYDFQAINKKFDQDILSFTKNPTPQRLQHLQLFIYYQTIRKLSVWYNHVSHTELPIERIFENLVRDKIKPALQQFISLNRLATKWFKIKLINPDKLFIGTQPYLLSESAIAEKIKNYTESYQYGDEYFRLLKLHDETKTLFNALFEPIRLLKKAAEISLDQSFLPLKEELQKSHSPHLALVFAFIRLFQMLQADLNGFAKKHLDFFYKDVLRLVSNPAVGDQAHIVFEIQKELKRYLLTKGLLLKDGKDVNKEEILFALDQEIVVNQTQVKDVRTLFLNNYKVGTHKNYKALTEGLYIAPKATMADGVDKDFQTDVRDFYTVGNKPSKYILPGTNVFKPYPSARIGFILASPVLFLREGKRTITISIKCLYDEDVCAVAPDPAATNPCCEDQGTQPDPQLSFRLIRRTPLPLVSAKLLLANITKAKRRSTSTATSLDFNELHKKINSEYYYVNQELIAEAVKKGLSKDVADELHNFLIEKDNTKQRGIDYCYCPPEKLKYDAIVDSAVFDKKINTANEVVKKFFKKRKPFDIQFSGETEWIDPSDVEFSINPLTATTFEFNIVATLLADKGGVTFYNKEALLEDFDTEKPIAKILLDDHFKILYQESVEGLCLDQDKPKEFWYSLYQIFRHVRIDAGTRIDVKVCSLRNFVVQNNDTVMDVNSPVYAFGVRPRINSVFYIGSEEIFLKNWDKVSININWKDFPSVGFDEYYHGYQYEYRSPNGTLIKREEVVNDNFQVKFHYLEDGNWYEKVGTKQCGPDLNDPLFQVPQTVDECFGNKLTEFKEAFTHQFTISRTDFNQIPALPRPEGQYMKISRFDVNTRNSFLRLTLKCQDFQHEKYVVVLARQLAAEGKLPTLVDGAVYYNITNANAYKIVNITEILDNVTNEYALAEEVRPKLEALINDILSQIIAGADFNIDIGNIIWQALFSANIPGIPLPTSQDQLADSILYTRFMQMHVLLETDAANIAGFSGKGVVIPKEPWTPTISQMTLDYSAWADLSDIDLLHLYPFSGTYKQEQIQSKPTLLPTFCNEGTLYLGLEKLIPPANLNILFQLAEATADSELDKKDVLWHYLDKNVWRPLRVGFEVIEDETQNLTTTGIIRFALPENMTTDNTIMPKDLHWISATIASGSRSVSDTTGIYTQAVKATFTNTALHDKLRLDIPIEAGQISKLETADASVKQVLQPYPTFGGRVPEDQKLFYVRVSEHLRHKGRAIQKFDYERIVLHAFPEIFKAKCINHSLGLNAHEFKNDFPYAPGYIIIAVIPDLKKLKAGNSYEPKAPVSLLEKIDDYVRRRTSTFARIRTMNPRYEKIHLCLRVRLLAGKDEGYYKSKLITDLRHFFAPWAIGEPYHYKLTFGQCVDRSSVIGFIESLDYIDFILEMKMRHEFEKSINEKTLRICPETPRSILLAGDIEICIDRRKPEQWCDDEPCSETPERIIPCETRHVSPEV